MHHDTDVQWFMREVAQATSFTELAELALCELRKFPNGASIVCGPITTGGRGNVEDNLALFDATIKRLQTRGKHIFTQMPYEKDGIFRLTRAWKEENPHLIDGYHAPVLEGFYRPLFESRLIVEGIFLPDWESSKGARWERILFEKLGLPIWDLRPDWAETFQYA